MCVCRCLRRARNTTTDAFAQTQTSPTAQRTRCDSDALPPSPAAANSLRFNRSFHHDSCRGDDEVMQGQGLLGTLERCRGGDGLACTRWAGVGTLMMRCSFRPRTPPKHRQKLKPTPPPPTSPLLLLLVSTPPRYLGLTLAAPLSCSLAMRRGSTSGCSSSAPTSSS